MNKKLILFSHHKVDGLTIDRFNTVKKLNPSWDVIPIGFKGYELLEGSIITNREKYPTNKKLIEFAHVHNEDWANPDLFLYDGYFQMPNYDEYFLYEYDTMCNVSIEEFFNTNVDFFGNGVRSPADEKWWWPELFFALKVFHRFSQPRPSLTNPNLSAGSSGGGVDQAHPAFAMGSFSGWPFASARIIGLA